MIKYKARTGAPFKQEDAQEIGEFICEDCNGLTTEEILKKVKQNKKSVIHSYIEWDNKIASEAYRLQQVRNITNHIELRIVVVGSSKITPVEENQEISIRASHSINEDGVQRYYNVQEVFNNEDYKRQILNRATIEIRNWMKRYRIYTELSPLIKAINNVLPMVVKKLDVKSHVSSVMKK